MNFEEIKTQNNDSWPEAFVQESLISAKQVILPNTKMEDWRFTPITKKFENFEFAVGELRNTKAVESKLYFQNGKFNFESSTIPTEIEISPIDEISEFDFLGFVQDIPARKNPLLDIGSVSLNNACHIKIKAPLKSPLVIVFESFEENKISQPIILIEADANTKGTIFEKHISDCTHFENRTVKLKVNSGANITHIVSTLHGDKTIFNTNTHVEVKRDATYTNFLLSLSGELVRHNLDIRLSETGSHANSYGLYALNKKEHVDNFTYIHHASEDTTSTQLFKGILDENSKGIFTGKILVDRDSQRVNSSQLNKILLLTKKAQSHSQPQLEIFADDVKCSHGSTTGQLNPEEVFYFQSRGINEKRAKILLSQAFVNDVLLKIEDDKIREELTEYSYEKFSQFQLGEL